MTEKRDDRAEFEQLARVVMRLAVRKGKFAPAAVCGGGLQAVVDTAASEAGQTVEQIADWLQKTVDSLRRSAPLPPLLN